MTASTVSRLGVRRTVARGLLAAALVAAASLVGIVAQAPPTSAYATSSSSFSGLSCTGWSTLTAPPNAIQASFTIYGGGGAGGDTNGGGGGNGGNGAWVSGTVALSAGQSLRVRIGCGGTDANNVMTNGFAKGGASASTSGGGGGGATVICLGGDANCTGGTVLAVAAGGGGGGSGSGGGSTCSNRGGGGGGAAGNFGSTAVTGGTVWHGAGGGAGNGSNGNPGGGGGATTSGGGGGGSGSGSIAGSGGSTGSAPPAANRGDGTGAGGFAPNSLSGESTRSGGGGGGGYSGGGGGAGGRQDCGIFSSRVAAAGGGGGGSSFTGAISSIGVGTASGSQGQCDPNNISAGTAGQLGTGGRGGCAGWVNAVTWTLNTLPTGSDQTTSTANKREAKVIGLNASDADGNGVTCSLVGSPTRGTVSLGGPNDCTATYTPTGGLAAGTGTFKYKVTDSFGGVSPEYTVSVPIGNRNPSAPNRSVNATKGVGLPITLSGTDVPDGDTITSCTAAQPAEGTLTGTGCSLTYTAPPDVYGTDTFTYTVSDGFGGTSTSATVTVAIDNRAPAAAAQTFTVGPESETELVLGGGDPDGDETTCATSGLTGGSLGELGDCTYLYVAPVTPGTYTFSYTRTDGAPATSSAATVTIIVTPPAVQGIVTADDTGEGIPGITVRLYEDGVGFTAYSTTTDAEGAFDLGTQVPAGEYRVIFRDPTQDFVDEWYDDSLTRSGSTPVEFNGVNDLVLEASLATGAQIDVSISNPGTYTVALYNTAPTGASAYRSVPGVTGSTSLRGLPAGTYYVSVTDPSGTLVQKWSGNQTVRDDAVGIDLDAGEAVASPFSLPTRNTIAGTIIDSEGPVAGVTVQAYGATSAAFVKSTKTDAQGDYVLKDLAPGGYKLVFRDPTGAHPVTWFGGDVIGSATTLTMLTGGALDVDTELPLPATVSGTVTGGPDGTTPLAGAKVTLYRGTAAVKTVTADANGTYSVTDLAPGGYTALFTATGHRSEYNLDRYRKADADVIQVGSGEAVDLDATLTQA